MRTEPDIALTDYGLPVESGAFGAGLGVLLGAAGLLLILVGAVVQQAGRDGVRATSRPASSAT